MPLIRCDHADTPWCPRPKLCPHRKLHLQLREGEHIVCDDKCSDENESVETRCVPTEKE